jgi:hypothetical protein
MPINKIAHSSLEENQQNYINILRSGHSVADTGWTTYSDSAGVNPVDGIGGSASITWSQNTSSPLSGDSDLRLVKSGSTNRQGDGVSIPFTIANRHLGKVLQITFDMELISGTYASGDLRISIIQDPSGTPVVLEPVGTSLELGIANQRIREIATFQTHISITSYRLCIHVSSTSASAYTVDFANFKVWEPTQSIGSIITDWTVYTPTPFGMTLTSSNLQWRRVGSNAEIRGRIVTNVVSSATSISLPNGLVANTGNASPTSIGTGSRAIASEASTWVLYAINNDSKIYNGGYIGFTSTNDPFVNINALASGNEYTVLASVPIAGWGSSVAMSSDSGDGRNISATVQGTLNTGASTSTNLTWNSVTILYDTHGSFNATTGYTAPVSGYYQFNGYFNTDSSNGQSWSAWVSGSNRQSCGLSVNGFVLVSGTVFLLSGQNLTFRPNSGSVSSVSSGNYFTINRISAGSQVIASSEFVACSYYATSNTPQTSLTVTLKLPIRIYDTHGAWGTATGQFTAPISGKYRVTLIGSLGGGQPVRLFKQNVSYCWIGNVENHSGTFTTSCDVDLLAGNVIDIRTSNGPITATAWTGGTLGDNSVTVISISRIGM